MVLGRSVKCGKKSDYARMMEFEVQGSCDKMRG